MLLAIKKSPCGIKKGTPDWFVRCAVCDAVGMAHIRPWASGVLGCCNDTTKGGLWSSGNKKAHPVTRWADLEGRLAVAVSFLVKDIGIMPQLPIADK